MLSGDEMTLSRLAGRVLACSLLLLLTATPALAAVYDLPPSGSDVIGKIQVVKTQKSDTFISLANQYDVGYVELKRANPDVDAWLPGVGTKVIIPTRYVLPHVDRKGIVINLAEMRIYYFPPKNSEYAGKVFTFPIGIGRQGWSTPLTHTRVSQKVPHPSWTPPASIKKEHAEHGDPLPDVVPAGPDNPLGQYALRLGLPAYLIHGTNKPDGIGMRVSHGCIRLFPRDIKKLFSMVSVGTPVNIISKAYKVGWNGDTLVLEAHTPKPRGDKKEEEGQNYTPWVKALIVATKDHPDAPINWDRAEAIVHKANGIPESISGDSHSASIAGNGPDHDTRKKNDARGVQGEVHSLF
jgi:L,D-transpeptidase ErfK/SrfK